MLYLQYIVSLCLCFMMCVTVFGGERTCEELDESMNFDSMWVNQLTSQSVYLLTNLLYLGFAPYFLLLCFSFCMYYIFYLLRIFRTWYVSGCISVQHTSDTRARLISEYPCFIGYLTLQLPWKMRADLYIYVKGAHKHLENPTNNKILLFC